MWWARSWYLSLLLLLALGLSGTYSMLKDQAEPARQRLELEAEALLKQIETGLKEQERVLKTLALDPALLLALEVGETAPSLDALELLEPNPAWLLLDQEAEVLVHSPAAQPWATEPQLLALEKPESRHLLKYPGGGSRHHWLLRVPVGSGVLLQLVPLPGDLYPGISLLAGGKSPSKGSGWRSSPELPGLGLALRYPEKSRLSLMKIIAAARSELRRTMSLLTVILGAWLLGVLLEQRSSREKSPSEELLPNKPLKLEERSPKQSPELESSLEAIFGDFREAKSRCGEATAALDYLRFRERLLRTRRTLIDRFACSDVHFRVYVKEGKAALKAAPILKKEITPRES